MDVDRRHVLGGLALAPALTHVPARPSGEPRRDATALVRLQGSLDPRVVSPWWYDVAVYAVIDRSAPVLMLRAEGCETYMMRREADGQYRARGATVTAFKHADDESWIDWFDNPVTGARNAVHPNILTGGAFVYPADGSVPLPVTRGGATTSGWVRWLESGPMVGCMMERKSTGAWQPYMETASIWTTAAALRDGSASVDDATFASTFLAPWPAWMEMGDRPGHLLWHSTGRKLRSLDDLPPRYRARAEQLAPGVLARDPWE